MLVYDNEYQTKENPNWTKNKIELQQIFCLRALPSVKNTLFPKNAKKSRDSVPRSGQYSVLIS